MITSLVILIICLLFSMFFSASETAFTASSRALIHEKEHDGDKKASILARLKNRPDRFLSMILLGNNVVNIAATAITTSLCIIAFGNQHGVFISTFIVSLIVLIFCEILPKTIAIHYPNTLAFFLAPALWILTVILAPFIIFLNAVVKNTLRLLGLNKKEKMTEDEKTEIRGVINLHANTHLKSETNMLKSVLDLSEVNVSDVMTYRDKIASINADLPIRQLIDEVMSCPYTRIPLWKNKKYNIVGVLHTKLLLRALHAYKQNIETFDIMTATTAPWFIPETTSLLNQLQAFRRRHEHFSIVVDEYGVIQGIITLEDVLEEIVGDIADETDHPQEAEMHYISQPDGSIIISGQTSIRDLNRHFGWELPDDEASTLAGLLLYESERVPHKNATYSFYGFGFEVLEKQKNCITQIRIIPPHTIQQ